MGAREAVDLLLSGDTRAALDAYRGLLATNPDDEALQWAVRLLERELARCPQGGVEPCIQ